MIEAVPAILQSLLSSASLQKAWSAWRRRSKGNAKLLIGELQQNLRFCTLVLEDGLDVGEALHVISTEQYERLAGEDPDLKSLSPRKIRNFRIEDDANLAAWQGQLTVDLVDSIYEKLQDIKVYYPNPKSRKNRRWKVRVVNIRNKILLLLKNART